MKISESQYVPVLKWRQAEYQSLNRLFASQKSDIVPLLVVPPIEYDFKTRQPVKSIQDHIVKFVDRYINKWGDRKSLIDLYPSLHDSQMDSGESVMEYIFRVLNENNCRAVPVLSSVPDTIDSCCRIAIRDKKGIALRIKLDNILDGSLLSITSQLNNHEGILNKDIDIIIDLQRPEDFEPIDEFASALASILNSIEDIEDFRSLILISTSIRLNEIEKPGGVLFRYEWALYAEIIKEQYKLRRIPTFGDYTIETPDFSPDLDFRKISPSAKIVYTVPNEWLVVKGSAYRKDTSQMFNLSKEIVKSRHYSGPDFSFGDKRIKEIVNSEAKPGNLTTMKQVGISHHLAFILSSLSKIHEKQSTV